MRTRAEIERDLQAKRRERDLYCSPVGITGIHAQIDRLLEEWETAGDGEAQRPAAASA